MEQGSTHLDWPCGFAEISPEAESLRAGKKPTIPPSYLSGGPRGRGHRLPPSFGTIIVIFCFGTIFCYERQLTMKDFELVQAECCNYNGIGCDGIDARSFPTWFPNGMKPRAKCLIAEGKKCRFFRRTVLCEDCCTHPATIERTRRLDSQTPAVGYDDEQLKALDQRCAACGQPRPKGFSYCEPCRQKQARLSKTRRMRRYRKK